MPLFKRVLIPLLSLLLCAMIPAVSLFAAPSATTKPTQKDAIPLIILDAGHGGEDGGAVGVNGVLEKTLNLTITRLLATQLRTAGFLVLETRTEDRLLYSEGTKRGHKKQSDLENRLAVMQKYPESIFVSIHMNTFQTPDCEGLQVWYSEGDARSKALAECVQDTVKAHLQPQNNRRVKAAGRSIYILKHATSPAILVECGFLSTPAECELLCNEAYQRALALTLFAAICENILPDSCATGG